jgi:hypothetical protein
MANTSPDAGAAAYKSLQRAAHLGTEFLAKDIRIKGGVRDHVHEYKRVPGGATEPMGRKLYTIDMNLCFIVGHPIYNGNSGPLRRQWEDETVGPLVIPTIGTIQAKAIDWEYTHRTHMLNGQEVHVQFREHSTDEHLAGALSSKYKPNLKSKSSIFIDAVKGYVEGPLTKPGIPAIPSPPQFSEDVFSQITGFADQISTLLFSVELEADQVSAKIDQMIDACNRVDQMVVGLNDPMAWRVVQALQDLAARRSKTKADLAAKGAPLALYSVPREMSIVDVSSALYGDTTHAAEVMLLNGLENPLRIEPGTVVRYYQPSPLDRHRGMSAIVPNEVELRIAGETLKVWESYTIELGILTQPNAFSMTVGSRAAVKDLLELGRPGQFFELYIDGLLQFVGYTDGATAIRMEAARRGSPFAGVIQCSSSTTSTSRPRRASRTRPLPSS